MARSTLRRFGWLLWLSAAFWFAGCVSTPTSPPASAPVPSAKTDPRPAPPTAATPPVTYPRRVENFGQFDRFPAVIAGYKRGNVNEYEPDMADYSIGYDRNDAELQQAVTLYFYPRLTTNQFEDERAVLAQAHPGAVFGSVRTVTLQGRSGVFNAQVVTFEFDDKFYGRQQRLTSQLLMVLQPDRSFKVRTTAPVAQASAAEAGMRLVVEGVDWVP